MKKAFREYFDRVGQGSPEDQKRLFGLYHAAARLLPGEIENVFFSPGNGTPDPEAGGSRLWFFSGEYAFLARDPGIKEDFEVLHLKGLQGLHLTAKDLDLQSFAPHPGSESDPSLTVEFHVPRNGLHRLQAEGGNCAQLAAVTLEHLKGNL